MILSDNNPPLRGVGDFVDVNALGRWETYQKGYAELLQSMIQRRSRLLHEKRNLPDRQFHYGVDTSNIITGNAVNASSDDTQLLFVTQDHLRAWYCQEEGRSPFVPFFLIAAEIQRECGEIGDLGDYFADMHARVDEIRRDLAKATRLDQLSVNQTEAIYDFFLVQVKRLRPDLATSAADARRGTEALSALLKNRRAYEKQLETAEKDLKDTASFLVSKYRHIVESDPSLRLMENKGEDPIMAKIRSSFVK
jgi:hypothetical protein